ncbi:MAG TPA: ABC transporter substrate-binding protein [Candidatus Dormibacteraeota bacterium]|nr:ABC transporter substrate-binding protein [Candidatus Dormibacteraeota bacterium]
MRILRNRLASTAALGTALILVACGGGGGGSTVPTQTGSLNIGVIAPFTGPAAEFGTLLTAPCLAASDLINAAGGIMSHQVNCQSIDDTGDPADAVPNVTKAIATSTNLDMAIGLESNTAATTVPIVNNAKIPFLTTNGLVAFTRNNYPYYYRLTPGDDANGAAFAVWAVQQGYKKVAVVFQNAIGSEGNLPGLQAAMPKLGGNVVINKTIPADAASYSAEAASVIAANPDVLIWSADPQTTATFMSNYKQLNSGKLPPMVTATDSLTPDFFNAVKSAVGLDYVTSKIWLVGSYFDQTTPAFNTYKNALLANSKTHDIAPVLSTVGPPAGAYDGINIMALAMIMAKTTVGSYYNQYVLQVVLPKAGATVVNNYADGAKALAAGKTIQYVGVLGQPTFDKYHNSAGEFDANKFNSDGSATQVGTISGAQVIKLLG